MDGQNQFPVRGKRSIFPVLSPLTLAVHVPWRNNPGRSWPPSHRPGPVDLQKRGMFAVFPQPTTCPQTCRNVELFAVFPQPRTKTWQRPDLHWTQIIKTALTHGLPKTNVFRGAEWNFSWDLHLQSPTAALMHTQQSNKINKPKERQNGVLWHPDRRTDCTQTPSAALWIHFNALEHQLLKSSPMWE